MKSEKLEVKNLVFNYGVNNILNDISFNVDKGEFVAVVGKSGAGKSTLLRCLNLLNKPKYGEINIAGENIVNYNKKKLKCYHLHLKRFLFYQLSTANPLLPLSGLWLYKIYLFLYRGHNFHPRSLFYYR